MSPFPQGPHCHQGPPFPHWGIGNPWLGPYSSYVNIQDPKQRRIAFDNVREHVMEALGSSKYDGPPAQAPSSGSLTPRNNPVCFSDLITETFLQQAGGAIGLPSDSVTYHPQTGVEIVHPQADWLTLMRVETLLNFLPPGLATVTTFHSSRGQDMLVHDLRGGKRFVPHHMVTVKDLLRLLVEEEWSKHSTKVAATRAFNNISILRRESWLVAAARFVQSYRASTVDPASPYVSEEAYFWSQLPVDQLDHLQTKIIELCIPQPIDRTAKEAQLNDRKDGGFVGSNDGGSVGSNDVGSVGSGAGGA